MTTSSSRVSGSQYVEQLSAAWRSGRVTAVEQFFAEYPGSATDSEIAVRLIYEEFCLRQEDGQDVQPQEMLQRFPQWRSKLALVLDCHQLVLSTTQKPQFPALGEQFGEFRLLAELGRGSEGRVFLATQPLLSDRPVVVKIVPCRGTEHLSLARLQHTSIVPLYFVQEHPERNLRLLCMPYVGGISLDQLLQSFANVPVSQRSGKHLVEALETAREEAPVALPIEGPALQFLPLASYPQAVCWIGACVADALQYAHGRDLLHLDLKPSNVLLAGVGQPMLLDFHLARGILPPDGAAEDWLGGTPGYMSPEQEQAIAAIRQSRPVPMAVDARSDIYSLGLLLYELLGGLPPDPSDSKWRPDLNTLDSSLPTPVVDVVKKCLALEPKDRYAEAGLLAIDLRQRLLDAPTTESSRDVPIDAHRSRVGRGQHYLIATAVLAIAAMCGMASFQYLGFGEAPRLDHIVVGDGRADRSSTEEKQIADDLHAFVDGLRFLDRFDSLPADQLQTLDEGCRRLWRERSQLVSSIDTREGSQTQQRIRADLLDLAILWADLHVQLATPDQADQTRRDALQVLAEAEAELGRSVVLSHERQVYAAALGLDDEARQAADLAAELAPHTAWEHYAVGRRLLRAEQLDLAAEQLRQAVDIEPQEFWPNFSLGVCAYGQREFETALAAFSACVAIRPDCAECYLNRGLAYQALDCEVLAAHDFATAHRLDPSLEANTIASSEIPK